MTALHPIAANARGLLALQQRRSDIESARAVHAARVADERAAADLAESRYQAAASKALDAGKTPPPRPVYAYDAAAAAAIASRFAHHLHDVRAQERAWLARNAAELEQRAAERQAELVSEASTHVRALEPLAGEATLLRETVRTLRGLAGVPALHDYGTTPGPLDVAGLVRSCLTGRGFLHARPEPQSLTVESVTA